MFGKKTIIGLLLLFTCLSCTKINDSNPGERRETSESTLQPQISVDTKGIQDAINIAVPALYKDQMAQSFDYKLYILTSVQQIMVKSKWIWRVTFKPKDLLPDDPAKGIIGLGGEVFVNVDLGTKDTVITYGE